jgi:2-keto-4-pentenoate hydratase
MYKDTIASAPWMRAADRLIAARETSIPAERFPEFCRPTSLTAALLIQHYVGMRIDAWVGGWKSSVPGPMGATAPLFVSTIYRDSPCPVRTSDGSAHIEPEIAFILGRDLTPRTAPYSDDEVCDAVGEIRLSLELIGSRYAKPAEASFPELLADNLSNQGVFLGPAVAASPRAVPSAIPITLEGPEGLLMVVAGGHPEGNPFAALVRLTQALRQRGEAMRAGQVIITGSFAGVLKVPVDNDLRIGFGELGTLRVEFSAMTIPEGDGVSK